MYDQGKVVWVWVIYMHFVISYITLVVTYLHLLFVKAIVIHALRC
jgi:hypothetical protein